MPDRHPIAKTSINTLLVMPSGWQRKVPEPSTGQGKGGAEGGENGGMGLTAAASSSCRLAEKGACCRVKDRGLGVWGDVNTM